MEVHHHPQLKHEPKPWKEYILEYFMIFLAVMTGFFAESLREHLSDRGKETEYMRSMVEDLKADTAEVIKAEAGLRQVNLVIDTMLTCLKSNNPDPGALVHAVSRNFWTYSGFSYNNRTIQQLKSSGYFRLIGNKAVADSILKYDNLENAFILNEYNDLKGTLMTYKNIEAKVINYKELSAFDADIQGFSDSDFAPANKPALVTTDKQVLASYYNSLFIHGSLCHTFSKNLKHSQALATRLIAFIKKEYKLKDE